MRIQREGRNCPSIAKYYTCPYFEGCCEVDACKVGTCPRQHIPTGGPETTIAAVAPPVMVSETPVRSSTISSPHGITGAWYTDTKTAPAPTSSGVVSLDLPSPTVTEVLGSSSAASQEGHGNKELSATAKGGIIGAFAVLALIFVVGYSMCRKQRRRKVSARDSDSSSGRESKAGVNEEVIATLGGRYEEPHSRFDRESTLKSNSRMMNHPISASSRDLDVLSRPSAVIARPTTASPLAPKSAFHQVSSAIKPTVTDAGPSTRGPTVLNQASEMIARYTSASPDLMSRLDTATPEIQGPPQQAAVAELASPGLPKVVEIHSSRSGVQKYKPYRPNANSLYPVAETTPSYLTGTLAASGEH
ncbi:hypothetical protein CSOJ01_06484 [Colletotrichum sojae]|uniref:Uncharacterized protein n=1 Tax=Colletotrichum sojae TaxID=2175907 RepID=A0A8H6JCH1_9PEZI|nr:hypothetical protein CSOJ01_06484 [Colletotrichum sojae]